MADAGSTQDAGRDAGQVYASLVTSRLAEEQARHSSLQARGLAVVTTSGTLVALIFAVAQFALRSRAVAKVPEASRWILTIAAVAFVVAAIGGLVANIPHDLGRPKVSDISANIDSEWSKPSAGAQKAVARIRAFQLQKIEGVNDTAAQAVLVGLAAEVLAIALAAVAVVVTIFAK